MKDKSVRFAIVAGFLAAASSTLTWKLMAQTEPRHGENVPLTYTESYWYSLSPDDEHGTEVIRQGARRSDGSWTIKTHAIAADGRSHDHQMIFDFETAQYLMLDSLVSSVTTIPLAAQQVENLRAPRGCSGVVEASRVLDYAVVRHSFTLQSGAGMLQMESLVAPELGCLPLEATQTLHAHDGTERVIRRERVLDVRLGEPDDRLFLVPADFVEMSPIERTRARAALTGDSVDGAPPDDPIDRIWNQNYRDRQQYGEQ